jgi:hypothetical protein
MFKYGIEWTGKVKMTAKSKLNLIGLFVCLIFYLGW